MFDKLAIALAAGRRRQLLRALLRRDPDEPVRPTAVVDADGDPRALRTVLVHVHLPMLADVGLVRWQPDANRVTRGPRFEEIRPLLELVAEHTDDLAAE